MFKVIFIIIGIMFLLAMVILIGYAICFFIGKEIEILDRVFKKWRR